MNARQVAIVNLIEASEQACQNVCAFGCECAAEVRSDIRALGVTDADIELALIADVAQKTAARFADALRLLAD